VLGGVLRVDLHFPATHIIANVAIGPAFVGAGAPIQFLITIQDRSKI